MSTCSSSVGSSCQIVEDVTTACRRHCISLSSTDSEPFANKRLRTEASPARASAAEAADGDSLSSGNERDRGGRSQPPPFVGLSDTMEPPEEMADLYGSNGKPLHHIPVERVSEAAVAVVAAYIVRHAAGGAPPAADNVETGGVDASGAVGDTGGPNNQSGLHAWHDVSGRADDNGNDEDNNNNNNSTTNKGSVGNNTCVVVADGAPGALVLDSGTRVCLPDGSVVGIVMAVMGPVNACAYAILCHKAVFCQLRENHQLDTGTGLHYDLGAQHVITNPVEQCDTTRGTDASYVNDEELPLDAKPDFSDDEEERRWKLERRARKATGDHLPSSSSGDDLSEQEPVEVDWVKLEEVEEYLHTMRSAPVKTAHRSVRVVVPPWIAR